MTERMMAFRVKKHEINVEIYHKLNEKAATSPG